MITVAIYINERVIYSRSACNKTLLQNPENIFGEHEYKIDTGEVIKHVRSEGAVVLAKKMLDTIHEIGK